MKKFILAMFLLTLMVPLSVAAQDTQELFNNDKAAVIEDVEGFRASFKQYTQDPTSKVVKFEMVLTANIDSDRVKITWSTSGPNFFTDKNQTVRNISVEKGKTYNIPIELTITGYGVNELFGKAEAFRTDRIYVATVRKNFGSDQDSQVLPVTDEYKSAQTAYIIKTAVLAIIVFIIVIIGIFFGVKVFIKWLNKDDIK